MVRCATFGLFLVAVGSLSFSKGEVTMTRLFIL